MAALSRMNLLRYLAIFSFVAGATMLAFGVIAARDKDDPPRVEPVRTFDLVSVTATAESTATPEPTGPAPEATPTPTPVPYDGQVARMRIERFKVDAPIEAIGIDDNNQLEVPKDPHKVGWYEIYAKPGHGKNSVYSAHVDYWPDILGPFKKLKDITEEDVIVVVMDDGREYRYKPVRKARYEVDSIPMGDLIWPKDQPEDKEWITLITCGGDFVKTSEQGFGEYLHRDVVVAERIE
jgi:hypothetical protein